MNSASSGPSRGARAKAPSCQAAISAGLEHAPAGLADLVRLAAVAALDVGAHRNPYRGDDTSNRREQHLAREAFAVRMAEAERHAGARGGEGVEPLALEDDGTAGVPHAADDQDPGPVV